MSHPVPNTLYRIAAAAGLGSATVLVINAAKRAELIPTSAFTQLVAPMAEILALALGLVVLAAGTGWLAVWLFSRSSHLTSVTTVPSVVPHHVAV